MQSTTFRGAVLVLMCLVLSAAASEFVVLRSRTQDLEELRIVKEGKVYIRLHADKDGGAIELLGANEKPRLIVRTRDGGCIISMEGEKGLASRQIIVTDELCADSASLGEVVIGDTIRVRDGGVDVKIGASSGGGAFVVGLEDDSAYISMRGENVLDMQLSGGKIKTSAMPRNSFEGDVDWWGVTAGFRFARDVGFTATASGKDDKANWSIK